MSTIDRSLRGVGGSAGAHRLIALLLLLGFATFYPSQILLAAPPLPDGVAELARELEDVELGDEKGEEPPATSPADPGSPLIALRAARDDVQGFLQTADAAALSDLRTALAQIERAIVLFTAGSPNLDHLEQTATALVRTEASLKTAEPLAGSTSRAIAALRARLAAIAERMAADLLRQAEAAGVKATRLALIQQAFDAGTLAMLQGSYGLAIFQFGDSLGLAADTVTFDIALFEENIADILAGETVGHAFSITYQGLLYQAGESAGWARTAADAPATAQSPSKAMHVASVSKMLTAILVLRLLDEQGLTPDTLVAPYLPSNWTLGAGVENLTFKDFMIHESGMGQKGSLNGYQSLRDAIALPLGSTSFFYNNGNYGLMRVLVAGLMGIDPVDYPEFAADVLTASAFQIYADSVYNPIGVDIQCASNDPAPTIQYNFPDGGASGYLEPDQHLGCGGFGWFISSNELAQVLTYLRNTELLLPAQARQWMETEFLGYMDPANYGWIGGAYGTYLMHGGDWGHSPGELHACAVAFPIQVEVGLVINSERGAIPYQCILLQNAFEDAWVAN